LRLRPGLDESQVVEHLGPPLVRQEKGSPTSASEGQSERSVVLVYGEPGPLQGGLEIWVVLKSGQLVNASVEKNDLGIFRCDLRECPVIWNERALERLPGER